MTRKEHHEKTSKQSVSSATIPLYVLRDFVIRNFPVIRDIDEENALKFISGENYEFVPSSKHK